MKVLVEVVGGSSTIGEETGDPGMTTPEREGIGNEGKEV